MIGIHCVHSGLLTGKGSQHGENKSFTKSHLMKFVVLLDFNTNIDLQLLFLKWISGKWVVLSSLGFVQWSSWIWGRILPGRMREMSLTRRWGPWCSLRVKSTCALQWIFCCYSCSLCPALEIPCTSWTCQKKQHVWNDSFWRFRSCKIWMDALHCVLGRSRYHLIDLPSQLLPTYASRQCLSCQKAGKGVHQTTGQWHC